MSEGRLTLSRREDPRTNTTYLLYSHGLIAGMAVLAALITRKPEMICLGAPSMLVLALGMFSSRGADVQVVARLAKTRAVEGDEVDLEVGLRSASAVALVDVEVDLPYRFEPDSSVRALVSLQPDNSRVVTVSTRVTEWGVAQPKTIRVRARDRYGLVVVRSNYDVMDGEVRVHLPDQKTTSLLEPTRFRRLVGSHDSQDRGEGCEIADVRPYRPGDRLRSINWRISARRSEPWITVRHPDRSATVVLLLDAFAEVGHGGETTLKRSVRATMAIARGHLNAQDRVGLYIAGHRSQWLPPQLGREQLHRLTDQLLDTTVSVEQGGDGTRAVDLEKVLPESVIVLAISPLIDRRITDQLRSIRSRGLPVHVIEPILSPPLLDKAERKRTPMFYESRRVFDLEQEVRRRDLRDAGIALVQWHHDEPLEIALRALKVWSDARRVVTLR